MSRTALYRHYDCDDVLLYVGITRNPFQRWSDHANASDWSKHVVRIDLEWFDTWDEAYDAEGQAIRGENPKNNIARKEAVRHGRGRPSRGPRIVALFEMGLTPRHIAKSFGISTQAVYNHIKEAGYTAPFVTPDWRKRVLTNSTEQSA